MNSLSLPTAFPVASFLTVTAQAVGAIMLADFIAGIVHWLQDAYGSEKTPIFGPRIIRANIVHHHHPRFFTRLTWWQSSHDLVLLSAGLLGLGWWLGFLDWRLWLFAAVSANANQVHKWSHRTRRENGPVISFFQDLRVLQHPRHHALHHTDPKNTFYCPVTHLVNPILESIRFWSAVEWVIWRLTGFRHRHDTSNRGAGPGPAWLETYRLPPAPPARPTTGHHGQHCACDVSHARATPPHRPCPHRPFPAPSIAALRSGLTVS